MDKFFENFLALSNELSLFLLLGLLAAGVLKQLVSSEWIVSHIGASKASSVIKATLFGIPLPLCSCSVLPLAKSLQKQGASKGSVQSFLISTPITGIDSIVATYSLFGVVFTAYRVITSMIMAILTGIVQNVFDNKKTSEASIEESSKEPQSCCASQKSCEKTSSNSKPSFSVKEAFRYGYGILFGDIYLAMTAGIFIGAGLTAFVPQEWMVGLFENQFLTYLVVIVLSMPLYVCATASLPLGAAFMISGMSPGAVFIFLTAGPATSSIAMSVIASMFGKRSLFIYLLVILVSSLVFGFVLDLYFSDMQILGGFDDSQSASIVDYVATCVMFALAAYHFVTRKILKKI